MTSTQEIESAIREVLGEHAGLDRSASDVSIDDDLFEAGMTSFATVNVMLAIEDHFDVEFPEELLNRSTFRRIADLQTAVSGLVAVG